MKTDRSYNRKFNALIKKLDTLILPEFKSDVVCMLGVSGHDGCMGFTYFFESAEIQVVRCDKYIPAYTYQIGLHLNDTDVYHLADQLDVAIRDGFKNIFVHYVANKKTGEK